MRFVKTPKFLKTLRYLAKIKKLDPKHILEDFGRQGVAALSAATPVDTGETATKWYYAVEGNRERYTLTWYNSEMAGRVPLVILLQYGHATKSGYFLSGIDFINPALEPIFKGLRRALSQEALI